MLEFIASLLVALAVAMGAPGVDTAAENASPEGNTRAVAAIEAIIASVSAAVEEAQTEAGEKPETTGLDRATEVANENAAAGLEKAAEAKGGKPAEAAAPALPDEAPVVEAPPVDVPPVVAPPVVAPPVDGPPASHPPVPAPPVDTPPVPAPPIDAPRQSNRPYPLGPFDRPALIAQAEAPVVWHRAPGSERDRGRFLSEVLASLVLPTPPGPTMVTRRTPGWTSWSRSGATSSPRPKRVEGSGGHAPNGLGASRVGRPIGGARGDFCHERSALIP